jgi:prepilin-type N-terminal cleavage/methylation domain-containing protein
MKNERGFTLIETIIAVALLGVIAIAFLGALGTASLAIFIADERATAESLARSEMEYVKSANYTAAPWSPSSYELPTTAPSWDPSHNALPSGYDGYTANVTAAEIDTGIQKITIVVSHLGKEIISSGNSTLEDYKVDR